MNGWDAEPRRATKPFGNPGNFARKTFWRKIFWSPTVFLGGSDPFQLEILQNDPFFGVFLPISMIGWVIGS
jgi:hypothetical protein